VQFRDRPRHGRVVGPECGRDGLRTNGHISRLTKREHIFTQRSSTVEMRRRGLASLLPPSPDPRTRSRSEWSRQEKAWSAATASYTDLRLVSP
jgi:hypothetical protein